MKKIFIILISVVIICLTGLGVIGYFVERHEDKLNNQVSNEEQINGANKEWAVLDGENIDVNKIEGYTPGGKVVEGTVEDLTNSNNSSNTNTTNTNNNQTNTNNNTNNNTNENTNNSGDTNSGNTTTPGNDNTDSNTPAGDTNTGTPEPPSTDTAPPEVETSSIRAVTASTFETNTKNTSQSSAGNVTMLAQFTSAEKVATKTSKNTDESKDETNTEEKISITEVGGLKLPFTPPYKEMEIISIGSYTGKFIEDGSDSKKDNVLAMVVKNTSDKTIDYGEIIIKISGQNEALSFKISNLKPGTATLVLESTGNAKFNENDKYIYLDSKNDMIDEMPLMTDEIKITTKDKQITVENISDKDLNTVYVYYKTVSPGGCYLGGITYRTKFVKVNAGKTESVDTLHFSKENSEILKVESVKE